MKRKLILLISAALLTAMISGCGSTEKTPTETAEAAQGSSTAQDTEQTEPTTPEQTEKTEPTTSATEPVTEPTTPEKTEATEQTEQTEPQSAPTAEPTAEPVDYTGSVVTADYADEYLASYAERYFIEFVAAPSEWQTKLVFTCDGKVTDFKFLKLGLEGCDDEGNFTFAYEELYSLDELSAKCPLVVTLTFYGDLPEYGISYDNGTGEPQRFTVSTSGYDGSIVLSEF